MTKTLKLATDAVDRALRPRLRAVDYLRVSTEEQAKGYGIEVGGKRTKRYIDKKGWDHVETFKDPGVSGSLMAEHRDDLNRLMKMARQTPRPFEVVVVPEGRVIGRTERAYWLWVWELEDLGVAVADAKHDIDNTTPDGRDKMRDEANYAFKEYERIRTRTQSGIQEKALDGGYAGGRPRYGYRIENKGQKGDSAQVVDDCTCSGSCATLHEAEVLRQGRRLVVYYVGSWDRAALTLNAEGLMTRSGKPWSGDNLRAKLRWQELLEPKVIWRNPANAKRSRHRGVTLGVDGSSAFGETIEIPLPAIFSFEEVMELKWVTVTRPPVTKGRTYTLSRRLESPCGKHYTGGGGAEREYRCSGKKPEYAGAPRCSCPSMDAEAVEAYVWDQIRAMLGDSKRLRHLASLQAARHAGSKVDYEKRITDFERQIEEQQESMDLTMTVAARQAARKGLGRTEAEAHVERAVRRLEAELAETEKLLAETRQWQAEVAATEGRANDIEALAELAHTHMAQADVEGQARYIEMLDIRAKVVGEPITRKSGRKCSVGQWFTDRNRLVPELTDEAWERVAPLMTGHWGVDPRRMLDGILHKARSGSSWPEIFARFESRSVKTYWDRWRTNGRWEAVMTVLSAEGDAAHAEPSQVPLLEIEGAIKPALLVGSDHAMLERCA
ncbi:recombinase family protein [Streptomyces sp. NPDC093249]|uniref:recombinase family protein n=1 Tax=unclassified Streptomyces TaxID=2593676 RepID=UPI00344D05EB